MSKKSHLSIFGIGPYYALASFLLTLAACLLDRFHLLPRLSFDAAVLFFRVCSVLCVLAAAALWLNALLIQKIDRRIRQNELVTSGAYAWVRNPIYSAIMLLMWAALGWSGNLYLLLLCPVYPLFMTVLLKPTEEKWLTDLYGQSYLDYCRRVNRCIPWFPRSKRP